MLTSRRHEAAVGYVGTLEITPKKNPPRARKTSEQVAAWIVRDMTQRRLPTGSRLPTEAAMLDLYGVSRGSLREALRILEVNGLIVVRAGPHGGPHVRDLSATEVSRTMSLFFEVAGSTYAEVLNARIEVEPLLARLAAENITDQGRIELKESLRQHTTYFEDVAEDSYIETTQQFHQTVARTCGNSSQELNIKLHDIAKEVAAKLPVLLNVESSRGPVDHVLMTLATD